MINITEVEARNILTRASGFIGGFDFTLNPYRGCSFGCSYCYAAKHQYDNLLEKTWGRWVRVKSNSPELLEYAAKLGKLINASVYMSSVTDPYLPQERQFKVTQRCLKVLISYPPRRLVIQTRGPLIERDIELLRKLGDRLVVSFSVPTDNEEVREELEPTCASIKRRLLTISRLHSEGIRVYATVAPVLPCNPAQLASLLGNIVEGVIVSGFHDDGANGKNTLPVALNLIHSNGWGFCLHPTYAQKVAISMQEALGPKVYLGREGFIRLSHI